MASMNAWFPSAKRVDSNPSIEWEPRERADADAFAGAEYPAPDREVGERVFYTIMVMRGRSIRTGTPTVALLGVTADAAYATESRDEARVEDGEWYLRNHDDVPAAVCKVPGSSTVPEHRREWFRSILRSAHPEIDVAERASNGRRVCTDGGNPSGDTERIEDEYGVVERHVGTCATCGREIADDGSITGFDHVHDELCRHIDDGAACHDFRVLAVYEDGGDRRVA